MVVMCNILRIGRGATRKKPLSRGLKFPMKTTAPYRTVHHKATRNPLRIGPEAKAGPKKPVCQTGATRNILRIRPEAARNALMLLPFPTKAPAP
jgi:hypothetical protein